jgi:hypothetical protein
MNSWNILPSKADPERQRYFLEKELKIDQTLVQIYKKAVSL